MAASDRIQQPVQGYPWRVSFNIRSSATSNPITGGLTGLAGFISKDDGSFVSTTNTPVEIGTTGYGYLDLTAAEMTCYGGVVRVTASNANQVEWAEEFVTGNQNPTVAAGGSPKDMYTMLFYLWTYFFNYRTANQSGAFTLYKPDNTTAFVSGTIVNQDTQQAQGPYR